MASRGEPHERRSNFVGKCHFDQHLMLTVVGSALSFTATKFVQMPTYPIPSVCPLRRDDGLLWRRQTPTARGSLGQFVLRNDRRNDRRCGGRSVPDCLVRLESVSSTGGSRPSAVDRRMGLGKLAFVQTSDAKCRGKCIVVHGDEVRTNANLHNPIRLSTPEGRRVALPC